MNASSQHRGRRHIVRDRWLELIVVGGVVALVIGVGVLTTCSGHAPTNTPRDRVAAMTSSPTAASSPTQLAEATFWPATQTALATEYADNPPPKATSYALDAQAGATALASSPPPDVGPPSPQPQPPLQSGIDNVNRQGPFSAMEFEVRNSWQGPVESPAQWLLVFAGATKNVEAGGGIGPAALRVYRVTTTAGGVLDQISFVGNILAPTSSGPLTITAVTGTVMELRTAGGETLTFDLQTQQFQTSASSTPVSANPSATAAP